MTPKFSLPEVARRLNAPQATLGMWVSKGLFGDLEKSKTKGNPRLFGYHDFLVARLVVAASAFFHSYADLADIAENLRALLEKRFPAGVRKIDGQTGEISEHPPLEQACVVVRRIAQIENPEKRHQREIGDTTIFAAHWVRHESVSRELESLLSAGVSAVVFPVFKFVAEAKEAFAV